VSGAQPVGQRQVERRAARAAALGEYRQDRGGLLGVLLRRAGDLGQQMGGDQAPVPR
jgi:hypothetical protein